MALKTVNFFRMEYRSTTDDCTSRFSWVQIDVIESEVEIKSGGSTEKIRRTFSHFPYNQDRLLDSYYKASPFMENLGGSQNSLEIKYPDGKMKKYSWDMRMENADLSAFLEQLALVSQRRYLKATAWWRIAQKEATNGPEKSLAAAEKGIEVLGKAYLDDATIDETGTKLTLAAIRKKKGDIDSARQITERILEARIGEYKRAKIDGKGIVEEEHR